LIEKADEPFDQDGKVGERAMNDSAQSSEQAELIRLVTIDDEEILEPFEVLLPCGKAGRIDDQAWEVLRDWPFARRALLPCTYELLRAMV
jgi:hypothetical protein